MRDIGATLAQLRREKGLGQKQLAAILSRLAEFYDVTTDYLLGRTEYRCPPEALRRRVAIDFTVQDIINTVLELKPEARNSVVDFVKYMKHLYGEPPE